jgi:hypothetical protein
MIGLLMIRHEADMLAEALTNHSRFCDAIFVLDGTEGPEQSVSEEICRSFNSVKEYWTDAQTGYPFPLRDGARRFLLERSRARDGNGNWHAVLHGDEIWSTDPRLVLNDRPEGKDGIGVYLYHFFPHVSQSKNWSYVPYTGSIEACARYYMLPGIIEERLFLDSGACHYEAGRHSKVIPVGLEKWQSEIAVKQYNYRTPEQAHRRALSRRDSLWQSNHYQHLVDSAEAFFIETLASDVHKWASQVPLSKGDVTNIDIAPLPILNSAQRLIKPHCASANNR